MAPPPSDEESSQSMITASATRQGHSMTQKRHNKNTQEMEASDGAGPMDIDAEEQEDSQMTSAQELIANMVEGQRKLHMRKKRNVIKAQDINSTNLQTSIDTLFHEHEAKSSSAHESHLKRLKELLNDKSRLEAQMEAKFITLRANYDAHSHDIQNVLSHRIKELK